MRCREWEREEGRGKVIIISTDMNKVEGAASEKKKKKKEKKKEKLKEHIMTPLRRGDSGRSDDEAEPPDLPSVSRKLSDKVEETGGGCFNMFKTCCGIEERKEDMWDGNVVLPEPPEVPERPIGGFKKADRRVFKPKKSPKKL